LFSSVRRSFDCRITSANRFFESSRGGFLSMGNSIHAQACPWRLGRMSPRRVYISAATISLAEAGCGEDLP
jgi:hypothetical protein